MDILDRDVVDGGADGQRGSGTEGRLQLGGQAGTVVLPWLEYGTDVVVGTPPGQRDRPGPDLVDRFACEKTR